MKIKEYVDKLFIYGFVKFTRYAFKTVFFYYIFRQRILGSYSQKEEDIHIDKLLGFKKKGFYVDIGAYDPAMFSNTKRFYLRGWRGINIEPDPNNSKKFFMERKRDINLNIGVSDKNGMLTFYKFFPETLSTFSKKSAKENLKHKYKLTNKTKIQVKKLSEILENYCKDKKIDFMSIDTEGFDLLVLKSNNWKKFRPKLICVESMEHGITKSNKKGSAHYFLLQQGYKKVYEGEFNNLYMDF